MANETVDDAPLSEEEPEEELDPNLFEQLEESSEDDDEGAADAYNEYSDLAKQIDQHYELINEMRKLIWDWQSAECLTPKECQEIQRLSGLIAEERIEIDSLQMRMKKLENFGRVVFDDDDDMPILNPHLILFYYKLPLPWANKYPRPIQTKTADEICDENCVSEESSNSDSDSDGTCCSESDETSSDSDETDSDTEKVYRSEEESTEDEPPCPKIIRKFIKP